MSFELAHDTPNLKTRRIPKIWKFLHKKATFSLYVFLFATWKLVRSFLHLHTFQNQFYVKVWSFKSRGTVSTEGKFFNTDRTTVGLWQATLHSFASEACLEQLQCSALLHSEIITRKRLISWNKSQKACHEVDAMTPNHSANSLFPVRC